MNEVKYVVAMKMAKKLLKDGAINRWQYSEFDTRMQQKYKPKWSRLSTDLKLDNA